MKSNTNLLVFIFLCFAFLIKAQNTLSPFMVNTAGGSGIVNGVNYDYTIGEPYTSFGGGGCDSVYAGFQHMATDTFRVKKINLIASGSTTFCQGLNVTLTAPIGISYLWSNSATTQSISVSIGGVYTATVSNSCGNQLVSNSITVTVNPNPTLTTNTTNTLICAGLTTTITANGANTYSWNTSSTASNIAVSPATNTTYIVTGSSVAGCTNTAIQTISVNALPVVTTNATSTVVCFGNTTTITAGGASTYSWNTGPTSSIISVSPPTGTTNYTVTGTSAVTGCSNTTVRTISVNALPTVTTNATSTVICSGKTITITAGGANTYLWNTSSTSNSIAVVPIFNLNYTVTGTSAAGCTNTAIQSISVNILPTVTINATSTVICAGNTATITAGGGSTYLWNTGPTTTSIAISPASTTNYTVTGTSAATGCTNTAVQTVSVNALPSVTTIATNSVICAGSTSTITAGGANNYLWTTGPSTASFAVSPSSNTTYTVTGASVASGCTNTAIQTISVNAIPTITVNATGTVICSGIASTLTASGASSYAWANGPITATIIVTPSLTTSYTVTGTSAVTGCSNSAIQTLSVNATPTVIITPGNTTICNGHSATLTANGANTYSWNNSVTSSSIIINPTLTTSYTVVGTSNVNGCTNTAVQTISVNPSPTISVSGNTFICLGATAYLNASGASSYTWNVGANTSTVSVTPTATSVYTVTGSNSFNCSNSSIFQVFTTPVVTPSICLVTVDDSSTNNEIYWERDSYPQADTFIVLRESSASLYTPIARISKNAPGSYADTNRSVGPNNGNPNYSSYRYKIQFRDSCGNLSPLSPYHQSIFIQDNLTGNFNWNYYYIEGSGPVQTVNYVLYRQNVITSITTSVNGTAGTAMTDPQYASIAANGNVKWFVGMSGFSCDPSLRVSGTAAATISTTKSNGSNERQYPVLTVGIGNNFITANDINIYPNPVVNELSIDFGKVHQLIQLEISDVTGRLVRKEEINGNKFNLNMANIKNGIYFITLYENNHFINTYKIIVQHE